MVIRFCSFWISYYVVFKNSLNIESTCEWEALLTGTQWVLMKSIANERQDISNTHICCVHANKFNHQSSVLQAKQLNICKIQDLFSSVEHWRFKILENYVFIGGTNGCIFLCGFAILNMLQICVRFYVVGEKFMEIIIHELSYYIIEVLENIRLVLGV